MNEAHNAVLDYNKAMIHLWMRTIQQMILISTSAQGKNSHSVFNPNSGTLFEINLEDKNAINDASNHYVAFLQNALNDSFDKLSTMSEWAEQVTHVMQKSFGYKSMD